MGRYDLLKGIDFEIMEYLKIHPDPKDCTATQMIKEGKVRKTSLSRKFLQTHLLGLEERGFIYSIKVHDPIRKVDYTYYSLKPTCESSGECGIPPYIEKQTDYYIKVLHQFYSALQVTYLPLLMDYGALYEEFQKALNRQDWDFTTFSECYQSLKYDPMKKMIKNHALTPTQVEKLIETFKKWEVNQWAPKTRNSPPLFLEELTVTMIGYTISYLYRPECENCRAYQKCLDKSKKWVNTLLNGLVDNLPESDLTKFWQSILASVPEIKSDLLESYFKTRFNLEKGQNSTSLLKIFEDRRRFPFLYSKVIPISLGMLVEQLILPSIKKFGSICRGSRKTRKPR